MITICKTFTFDAAHHIPTMPEGHKCRGMHGHTYKVDVIVRGFVPPTGYFIDYYDIGVIWQENVHNLLDHRVLNEVAGLEIPTTEVLAPWIFNKLKTDLTVYVHAKEPQEPTVYELMGAYLRTPTLHDGVKCPSSE